MGEDVTREYALHLTEKLLNFAKFGAKSSKKSSIMMRVRAKIFIFASNL